MPDPAPTPPVDPPTDPTGGPPAPPAGDPPAPPPSDLPPAPPVLDAEATARELAEARREAAKYRTDLKKLQDAQKVADDAKLSEEEKRAARVTELEAQLAEREAALKEKSSHAAVVDVAARLGAAKPAMLHRLIAGDIEFDANGSPTNVETLVKEFLRANPEFATTTGRPTGDAGQGARGKSTLTRDDIKKMTPDQINARWSEVSEVLARGA